MKIILSPAKKMITDTDSIAPDGLPEFIEKTTEIQSWLKSKSKEELKTIWKCNDKITEQNFNRLENMDMELRVYEFSSGEELVRNLENDIIYDLLILDMCLGGMDGNETARIFRKKFPYAVLVFCSGQLKPTIESFLATPFRYLMKQQNSSQLLETMKEILNEVKKNSADPFLMAHYRQTMQKVKIRNILYIENAKRGGRIVVTSECKEADFEEKLLINQKPKQLLEKLKPYGFAMAQSTCLVNMNHIEVLHTTDFKFDTGEIMKISRACQNEFRNNANRYLSSKYL